MKKLMIFAMAALFISCKTAEFGFKTTDVNGMVYDFSNRPVAYCEISLGEDTAAAQTSTAGSAYPEFPMEAIP